MNCLYCSKKTGSRRKWCNRSHYTMWLYKNDWLYRNRQRRGRAKGYRGRINADLALIAQFMMIDNDFIRRA